MPFDHKFSVLIGLANIAGAALLRPVALIVYQKEWHHLQSRLNASIATASALQLDTVEEVLVVAEDKRFRQHRGIDLYGIARAIFRLLLKRKLEGASTITQQLVRVYTGDYRLTVTRKLKEVLLATLVDIAYSKHLQVQMYLLQAYFGWRMNGVRQAANRLGYRFPLRVHEAAQLIARLKHPEPKTARPELLAKIAHRANLIGTVTRSTFPQLPA
jgi:membrane peptidoglycan carboxypeptidase